MNIHVKTILSILLLSMFLIIGCTKNENKQSNIHSIITIDGENVNHKELMVYLNLVKHNFELQGGKDIWDTEFDGIPAEEVAKERALESIIRVKIINKRAEEFQLTIDEADIEQINNQIVDIMNTVGDDVMEELDLKDEEILAMTRESYILNKVYKKATENFKPDEEAIQQVIDENLSSIKQQDAQELLKKAKVRYILFKTHDYVGQKLVELEEEKQKEAKIKAEEVHDKAIRGEDFIKLVKEYSEDEESKNNDGEYIFTKGSTVKKLEDATFNLNPNEISEIIETDTGYYIIKLEEIIEPTDEEITNFKNKLNAVEKKIEEEEIEKQKAESFNKTYEEWKIKSEIVINEDEWDIIKINK